MISPYVQIEYVKS